MTLIDDAIYVDGARVASPASLTGTLQALNTLGGFAWIGMYRPDAQELGLAAAEFGLHELAVEDALTGHQRAKLDRYGDTRFVVLRPARYIDADETVEFGEVHVFVGRNFVIAIRHAESPDLRSVRARLEGSPDLLRRGPLGVLYAIIDQVVDEYAPVITGLQNDIDEIEFQLFTGDRTVTKRIYDLAREVMELQRAIRPLTQLIATLREDLGTGDDDAHALELRRSFRDVLDHVVVISEKAEEFRQTLSNALMTHTTLVAQQQNDEMRLLSETSLKQTEQAKKISAWAAIIFAPSLVAGVYGMNFTVMPGLTAPSGFVIAIVIMIAFALALFLVFRAHRWL